MRVNDRQPCRLSALRRTARALAVLLACLTSAAPATPDLTAQTGPTRRSFDVQVPIPPAVVPVAGTPWLVYELHLANFSRESLVVEGVDVVDADAGAVIANVRGDDLNVRLSIGGLGSGARRENSPADAQPDTIAPGMHAVLYLEVPLDGDTRPQALEHRVMYGGLGENSESPATVDGARIAVSAEPPVTLAPPLAGGPWAAIYHPSWERGHRRSIYAVAGRARIPGRFAIDCAPRRRGREAVMAN